MRRRMSTVAAALAASVALALAGCTGTEGQGEEGPGTDGRVAFLNYGDFGGGAQPQANYNPYLDASKLGAVDYVYEKLMLIDGFSCGENPWLATGYEWTDPQTLVMDMRADVTWNDGEDFSNEDVAFTFTMLKEFEVLDTQGVWRYLSAVEATGDDQVTFSFAEPGASAFTLVNGVYIVPEHIWSEQADPTTFANAEDPVGTGPMTVKAFNPTQLTIERWDGYWQADEVKVDEIRFNKADGGGQVDQLKLSRGEYDTNAMFVPDIQKVYVERDPENHHYWYAPGGLISVYMNLTQAPFDDVEFRKAISVAFDHQSVIDKAQLGYVDQASQAGLVVPGQNDWLPDDIEDEGRLTYDEAAADQALTDAGYVKNSDGQRLGKDGEPISFVFKVPGSFTDWVSAAEILVDNLQALGMDVTLERPTPETYEADRKIGAYDMLFGVYGGSCNMFRNFSEPLDSAQTAPIGEQALSNFTRWQDPETDALLADLQTATDEGAQQEAVAGLVDIMMEEVPNIPIWYGAKWFQYDTSKATGWPNESDPYANGGDNLLVLTNLEPSGQG